MPGRVPKPPAPSWRRLAAGLAAVVLAWAIAPSWAETGPPPFQGRQKPYAEFRPAQAAPAVPLHTPTGGVTTLRRFEGRVVLLNVWATWCPACIHELPTLDRLQSALGGDGFTVAAVSVDAGGADEIAPYLKRLDLGTLPVLLDPAGRLAEALEIREGLPWTFIIDRRGRVRGYVMGAADWDSPSARALIRHYMDGPD